MSKAHPARPQPRYWLALLCLVGLDYYSTLAYQPSIAFGVAGQAAPLAIGLVIAATLFGALPIYLYVAGRSPSGQGAIGLLERAVPGWTGKLFVLVLLGFAATDFVITRTLSAADAAEHLIHNPLPWWQQNLDALSTANQSAVDWLDSSLWQRIVQFWNRQMVVTILLSILSYLFWAIFRHGFTRAVVRLSVVVVTIYLGLTAFVLGAGLNYVARQPELTEQWWDTITQSGWHGPSFQGLETAPWLTLTMLSLYAFPAMALGLSGFELSMVVMPLVRGGQGEEADNLRGRIRNTRKLLTVAALLMCIYLAASTSVTTLLIPPAALQTSGQASNRALAYLAHGGLLTTGETAAQLHPWFGPTFGTLYDLSAIVILCLTGASVTIGLRDLVPEYLYRFGMELAWAHRLGAILYVFNLINLAVTLLFRASVEAQRGTYATSVLVLISGAGAAAALDLGRRNHGLLSKLLRAFFIFLTVGFWAAAMVSMVRSPASLLISLSFVTATMITSIVSRAWRNTELRFEGFDFVDPESKLLWDTLKYLEFPVLVPHRVGRYGLQERELRIRKRHRLGPEIPLVFVEAELGDASDFHQRPMVQVVQEDGRFLVRITRCVSVAHVIAAAALQLSEGTDPPEIHFGWSDESPITANLSFLIFGTGNIPWMVREILRKAEPKPELRPPVIVG